MLNLFRKPKSEPSHALDNAILSREQKTQDYWLDPNHCETIAIVEEFLVQEQRWWIWFRGTWWQAISPCLAQFTPHEPVYVVGRIGNTLVIEPLV